MINVQMFIDPLLRQLEMQRLVSHTQLFVSFLDQQRLKEEKRGAMANFLATRIAYLWQRTIQKRKKR